MAVFAAFGKITEKGYSTLKEGFRERHEQAVKRAQQRGANVLASYALMGPYDFLVLLDCPDSATAMRVLMSEAGGGNIRYETFAAVPMEEFTKMLEAA